ncbi:hypothetical protein ABIA39_000965 [Nocardia sp. GAS34]|uniref:hypothetical protein n=1 Tax=unclassified Nocardia TaxID=2637762 RepID=UPI003D1F8A85
MRCTTSGTAPDSWSARSLLYFGGNGFEGRIASLLLWFAAGLVTLLAASRCERRCAGIAAQPNTAAGRHASALTTATAPRETAVEAEEEMAEVVGV